jgi:selenocysteine lyase/cysteine desulfurase
MNIEQIRRGIPALSETTFFNTAGISPLPTVVADEMVDMIRVQEAQGRYRPDIQEMLSKKSDSARGQVASFYNVSPEEIAFTHSISEGLNIISEGIDWKEGDEVVVSDQEHPSGYMPWALRLQQYGVILKQFSLLPEPEGMVDRLRQILTDRTRVVALSHVTSSFGIRVPADEIVKVAQEAGALVGFDGAQSGGQFPIDLDQMGCDFYSATSYKWCLGPYGVGALYVKRDALNRLKVRRSGAWGIEKLDTKTGTFSFPDTARRFEYGARNKPLRIGYGRALRNIQEIGLESIEQRVVELVNYFKGKLSDFPGAKVQTPDGFSAGAINVRLGDIDHDALRKSLWDKHQIVVVSPAGGIRFSLAYFTTREEIDTTLEAIRNET